ncbi:recombinase family protein [Sphingomonas parapaucimobilis]|uniref:recombinase family protein n=1 Tax=Sphingomonas parapaucimobilis TaxID=28213 RepID=UPI00321A63C4
MTVLIGYARVSKADGSQVIDLQRDALVKAGVDLDHHLYTDAASGKRDDRPGLDACIKALRHGDTLVVWKLDRLGRDLRHLVNLVGDLTKRGIGLKVLAKLRLAQAAMGKPETKVAELCAELGITRQTLYRHVTPKGEIRPDGEKLLARKR